MIGAWLEKILVSVTLLHLKAVHVAIAFGVTQMIEETLEFGLPTLHRSHNPWHHQQPAESYHGCLELCHQHLVCHHQLLDCLCNLLVGGSELGNNIPVRCRHERQTVECRSHIHCSIYLVEPAKFCRRMLLLLQFFVLIHK